MKTYPIEFSKLEKENKELREMLKATRTFLLRLEAISTCGKISTTKGHIYTMRKRLGQILGKD